MKLPTSVRSLTRRALGLGAARSISAMELDALEQVVVIGVGVVSAGTRDRRLPGEQRVASLLTLRKVVADLPRQQPIVLHCG